MPASRELADWLGRTVHAIAWAGRHHDVIDERSYPVTDPQQWQAWLGQAKRSAAVTAQQAKALMEAIEEMTAIVRAGLAGKQDLETQPDFALTHRDISCRNVLVDAAGPVLLDFDQAGPENPWWDLVHHAWLMACRRLGDDPVDRTVVDTAVSAYLTAGGQRGESDVTAFAGLLRGMLGWASNNLRILLGEQAAPMSRRLFAAEQLAQAAQDLPAIQRSVHAWAPMLA
jgi:hypothetical protein